MELDPAAYDDALGEGEIDRLTTTLTGRVSFEIHRRFLRLFVRPGARVLEIGAGLLPSEPGIQRLGEPQVTSTMSRRTRRRTGPEWDDFGVRFVPVTGADHRRPRLMVRSTDR